LVSERQARMAAILEPYLEDGRISMQILSGNAEREDEGREQG
jgi:hypothetical protein